MRLLYAALWGQLGSATALRTPGGWKRKKSPQPMMKRLLLVMGGMLALAGIIYAGGVALLVHGLTTADPYPSFMADYHPPRFYADLESSFDQFVTQRFPVGSNAQDAIAKIGLEGFHGSASKSGLYSFIWFRHAGPCTEIYSIDLRENSDGTIAQITARAPHHCL